MLVLHYKSMDYNYNFLIRIGETVTSRATCVIEAAKIDSSVPVAN